MGTSQKLSRRVELSYAMNRTFLGYFRCPERYVRLSAKDGLSTDPGFFRFGSGAVGYGKYSGHATSDSPRGPLRDAWDDVDCTSGSVSLPFDLEDVVENLRLERYTRNAQYGSSENGIVARLYYAVRPFLPVAFRRHLQRAYLGDWSKIAFPNWPVGSYGGQLFARIDAAVAAHPEIGKDSVRLVLAGWREQWGLHDS